jgi:serine/threonine-protein phosphatase 2A regulatory subunit A
LEVRASTHVISFVLSESERGLGKNFFTEKLASTCVNWLGDDIATIRDAATTNLQKLTAVFGTDWACEFLMPSIDEIRHHPSYLRRLTAVQACARMAVEMDPTVAQIEVLPILLEMATDTVPNVRFNVALALGDVGTICSSDTYEQQIHPILSLLQDDMDRDVRFYADKSASLLEDHFSKEAAS